MTKTMIAAVAALTLVTAPVMAEETSTLDLRLPAIEYTVGLEKTLEKGGATTLAFGADTIVLGLDTSLGLDFGFDGVRPDFAGFDVTLSKEVGVTQVYLSNDFTDKLNHDKTVLGVKYKF